MCYWGFEMRFSLNYTDPEARRSFRSKPIEEIAPFCAGCTHGVRINTLNRPLINTRYLPPISASSIDRAVLLALSRRNVTPFARLGRQPTIDTTFSDVINSGVRNVGRQWLPVADILCWRNRAKNHPLIFCKLSFE